MTKMQMDEILKLKVSVHNAHILFNDGLDAQHAYLDMAEACLDMVLKDYYYGVITRL